MRYVVAAAEGRNFTRAAERNFVVQSALSHQIKALERELGVALFARTSRRVELTAAGEAFLVQARAALEAADRAAAEAAAAAGEVRGTLTIGLIPTVTAIDVPAELARFRERFPEVRIRLHVGGSDEFVGAIRRGDMDVAILGLAESTPPTGVATRVLARERLVAVLPAGHRFAGRKRLRLADLAEETFVDFPSPSPGRAQSDLAFAAAGVRRNVELEAMSTDLILGLVRNGLAVAILAEPIATATDGVRTVPLADGPVRLEYLAWSEFNPSPAATAFLRSARSAGDGPQEADYRPSAEQT